VGASREAGQRHVEVIRGAAHDAHAELGQPLQTRAAALEVAARARNDVADVDRLARLWIRHEAHRGGLVLGIEEGGQGVGRAREGGMGGDVPHLLAAYPDLAVVLEAPQEILTGTRGHRSLLQAATDTARSTRRCSMSRASACPPRPSTSPRRAASRRTIRLPSVMGTPRVASVFSHSIPCSITSP